MKVCKLNKKAQGGFSLAELLIVIVVIGVLMAVMLGMYSKYKERSAINSFATGSIELAVNIREAFLQVDRSYENVTTANVKASPGVIPSEMIVGVNVQNPWGGAITFAAANYASGTKNAVEIASTGIPKVACMSIAKILKSSFVGLKINATVVKSESVDMTSILISGACNESANSMTFTHQ